MDPRQASAIRSGTSLQDLKRRIPARFKSPFWSVLIVLKRFRRMRLGLTNLENFWWDIRFGGVAGPTRGSRYAHLGAHGVRNVSYRALAALFRHVTIEPGDVLVDVGCGRGRALNYWLREGLPNRLVGLEIDEEVAAGVRDRLKRYPNVEIVVGDAVEHIPEGASIFFMYSPFDATVMQRFKERLRQPPCDRTCRALLYYAPRHASVFRDDPAWTVTPLEMGPNEPACLITPRRG
jgi:SAM-dependent methyltransferase